MNCSKPSFSVLHHLPEVAQTYVHCQWCCPTISSSAIPFSCPQFFPAWGSFPVNQLFTSGGQSIGASASTSIHRGFVCSFLGKKKKGHPMVIPQMFHVFLGNLFKAKLTFISLLFLPLEFSLLLNFLSRTPFKLFLNLDYNFCILSWNL